MTQKIVVDGIEYVPAGTENNKAEKVDGLEYVIVRTYSAGVFAGYLAKRKGKEVTVRNARRLWEWYGAASLSELSQHGVKKPEKCKFPCEMPTVELTEAIEIIPCSEKAKKSIYEVKVWTA